MFLPDFDDVMEIHHELVLFFENDEDPINPPGARDVNLVYSACTRPSTGIGEHDKYPDEYSKLAALFHSLTQNHAFHNGNKRTALVTLLASLYRNGRILNYYISDDEIFEMTLSVANGKFLNNQDRLQPDEAVDLISVWLRRNTIARNIAPSDMLVTDFAARCEQLGCHVRVNQDGSQLISFEGNSIRIGGDTRQFNGAVAKRYLRMLGLSLERTGQTFAEFQNVDDTERSELYRYMSVLRRLAKI